MKGPGIRLDLDIRRLWRCSECGAERRTSGDRTIVPCHVCRSGKLMSLVEPRRPPRALPEPLDLTIELHPDDVEAAPVMPLRAVPEDEESSSQPVASVETEPVAAGPSTEKPKSDDRLEGRKSRRRSRRKSSKDPRPESRPGEESSARPGKKPDDATETSKSSSPSDSFGEGL